MTRARFGRVPRMEAAIFVIASALLVTLWNAERTSDAPGADYSSYDTSRTGYRALYDVLAREGVPVERFEQHPSLLPDADATLVYAEPAPGEGSAEMQSAADARALEAWVRAGGRLVYAGYDDDAARIGLLALPFTTRAKRSPGTVVFAPALRAAGVRGIGRVHDEIRYRLGKRAHVRVLAADRRGPIAIGYAFGRGNVVAIVDEALLSDGGLAVADRARFAYALVRPDRPHGAVLFDEAVHGYVVPVHWWSVVPVPFLWALGLGLVALIVATAGSLARLGPPVVPAPRDDRSSADFIDALATLLERGRATGAVRDDAMRSARLAVARSTALPPDASDAAIAAALGDQERRRAFETMVAHSDAPADASFVSAVALAQRVRNGVAGSQRPR